MRKAIAAARADLRSVREGVGRAAHATWRWTGRTRAELLHGAAIAAGWALLTAGVAEVVAWWGLRPWPLSAGLLLLSVAGWKHLRMLFGEGLYTLTKGEGQR